MERIPIKSNPYLFDASVAKIQTILADNFSWLDHSFGICEFLTNVKDGKRFNSANVYTGEGQYCQVMPCTELGNFSFFVLRDPQEITRRKDIVRSPFSLIIWYDTRKVSLPTDERNTELIKGQILSCLDSYHLTWMEITRVYEKPQNIFTDFSYDYTNNQFLMSPYAGIRIDGNILAKKPCWRNGGVVGDGDFSPRDFSLDYNI